MRRRWQVRGLKAPGRQTLVREVRLGLREGASLRRSDDLELLSASGRWLDMLQSLLSIASYLCLLLVPCAFTLLSLLLVPAPF